MTMSAWNSALLLAIKQCLHKLDGIHGFANQLALH
jgi:hypothetical protein